MVAPPCQAFRHDRGGPIARPDPAAPARTDRRAPPNGAPVPTLGLVSGRCGARRRPSEGPKRRRYYRQELTSSVPTAGVATSGGVVLRAFRTIGHIALWRAAVSLLLVSTAVSGYTSAAGQQTDAGIAGRRATARALPLGS